MEGMSYLPIKNSLVLTTAGVGKIEASEIAAAHRRAVVIDYLLIYCARAEFRASR
jgi:hypothetical protein